MGYIQKCYEQHGAGFLPFAAFLCEALLELTSIAMSMG